jgi:hypothetical protein
MGYVCALPSPPTIPHRADTHIGPYDNIPNDDMVGAQFIAPAIYRRAFPRAYLRAR